MTTVKRIIQTFVFSASFIVIGHSQALGVSEIDIKSRLNQNLDAEIKIWTETPGELDRLTIVVNPKYELGVASRFLQYKLVRTDSGNFIHITSPGVIQEPILGFQLEIITAQQARLLRDYALLIDLPDK